MVRGAICAAEHGDKFMGSRIERSTALIRRGVANALKLFCPRAIARLLFIATLANVAVVNYSFAQSDSQRINDLERKLEQSQQIIQELVIRLNKLEGEKSQVLAGGHEHRAATPTAPSVADAGVMLPVLDTPLHGFADVGGVITDNKNKRKGFTVGSIDLFLTPELGDHVKSLIETNFEVDSEGKLAVDVERLQIGYAFGDYLTAWLGRFHTPFGYWSTAYHHGTLIQTSVRRPQMIDFEDKGGIVPAHTVGVWGNGYYKLAGGKLTYDIFVGNAPVIEDSALAMSMAGLQHYRPSFGANIGYAFGQRSLDGLKFGFHWARGNVENLDLGSKTNLNFVGPYLAYINAPWEFIAELYRFDNRDLSGKTGMHGSWAGFAQLGYEIGRWTPYGRFERASLDQRDPYFRGMESGRSYTRGAFGLRFSLSPRTAIKLEYRHDVTKEAVDPNRGTNAAEAQFSIRF